MCSYTYKHITLHTQTPHMYMHLLVFVCSYTYKHTHVYTLHIPPNTYMFTYSYLCVYIYKTHTCIHTTHTPHTCTCAPIHICMHTTTYTHTQHMCAHVHSWKRIKKLQWTLLTSLHFLLGFKSGILLALTRFFFFQFISMVLGIDPGPHVCQANAQHQALFLSPFTA